MSATFSGAWSMGAPASILLHGEREKSVTDARMRHANANASSRLLQPYRQPPPLRPGGGRRVRDQQQTIEEYHDADADHVAPPSAPPPTSVPVPAPVPISSTRAATFTATPWAHHVPAAEQHHHHLVQIRPEPSLLQATTQEQSKNAHGHHAMWPAPLRRVSTTTWTTSLYRWLTFYLPCLILIFRVRRRVTRKPLGGFRLLRAVGAVHETSGDADHPAPAGRPAGDPRSGRPRGRRPCPCRTPAPSSAAAADHADHAGGTCGALEASRSSSGSFGCQPAQLLPG